MQTIAPAPVAQAPVLPVVPDSGRIINDYLAAWNSHDRDKIADFFDEQVVYFDPSFGASRGGRDEVIDDMVGVLIRAFPDSHWQIRSDPIVSADAIAYEWTLTGTNTGYWSGIPPTNQKLNLKGNSFVRLKNGKIVYQAVYYDGVSLNKQMGWE